MLHRLQRLLSKDDGVSMVLVALLLPVLVGMASLTIDVTRAFVERRELQNAVDAAALAAATYLPSQDPAVLAAATDAAIEYAARNGVTIGPGDVVFSTRAAVNDTATVYSNTTVDFAFAKIFGVSFGAVSSQGTSQLGILGGMRGVMPWGIEEPAGGFQHGQTYCIKLASEGQGGECSGSWQGNFQALDIDDLGNDSASLYKDRIINGSETLVRIGQVKNVARGNKHGPTMQGTGCTGNDGRISNDSDQFADVIVAKPSGGYSVLDWSSPRLVVIPQVRFPGPDDAEILGFVVFFIEDCTPNGGVVGRFIDTVVPGGEWAPFRPGIGTKVVRLIE